MAGYNSALPASFQGSYGTGNELQIPELLLPIISVPLPLASTPSGVTVDLRGVNNSAMCFTAINQGVSSALVTNVMAILDRGIYRFSGWIYALFTGSPANSSADPDGARLQLLNPQGTFAQTLASSGVKNDMALAVSGPPVWVPAFVVQLNQVGWSLQYSTFHSTGAGQTIGALANVYVERLM